MAVRIRLKRTGKHKTPYYRVVAIDKREAASGQPLEILGSYDPRADKAGDKITINQERYDYWIKSGAKPSDTVASLLRSLASGKVRKPQVKKSRKVLAKEKAAGGASVSTTKSAPASASKPSPSEASGTEKKA